MAVHPLKRRPVDGVAWGCAALLRDAQVQALQDKHIASATRETRQAMADRVFDNLASFFATGHAISAAT